MTGAQSRAVAAGKGGRRVYHSRPRFASGCGVCMPACYRMSEALCVRSPVRSRRLQSASLPQTVDYRDSRLNPYGVVGVTAVKVKRLLPWSTALSLLCQAASNVQSTCCCVLCRTRASVAPATPTRRCLRGFRPCPWHLGDVMLNRDGCWAISAMLWR